MTSWQRELFYGRSVLYLYKLGSSVCSRKPGMADIGQSKVKRGAFNGVWRGHQMKGKDLGPIIWLFTNRGKNSYKNLFKNDPPCLLIYLPRVTRHFKKKNWHSNLCCKKQLSREYSPAFIARLVVIAGQPNRYALGTCGTLQLWAALGELRLSKLYGCMCNNNSVNSPPPPFFFL